MYHIILYYAISIKQYNVPLNGYNVIIMTLDSFEILIVTIIDILKYIFQQPLKI